MSSVKPLCVAASVPHDGAPVQPLFKPPRQRPPGRCVLFLMSTCVVLVLVLAGCDKTDEPTFTIDYFFMVTCNPPDYEPLPKSDPAYTVTAVMKDSIRRVYPKATVQGADGEVIAACDTVYRRYLEEHPEAAQYFYCVAKLYRARMRGCTVTSYTTIKYYNF